ncbi:hypothetical protein [Bythopirellula goksoeyrii]|uniref:Uncharacterized protein n=1 Tax=Bythopirellula goksoeyrii TaxID=1400387 RepID=A0A5B9QFP5_9BACT|nr:hypothetical protein [Bythopirellula goksoeyrii]QEG36490.1 hypothetical protein Pr1d_38040 [Bythopirellula goksoeyrii]
MFLTSKRFWKRVGYGFLILIGVFILAYAALSLWANRLSARLEALRAEGEPTSIAELAPAPVPGEENGAAYLKEIALEIEAFAKDESKFYESPLGKMYEKSEDKGEKPSPEVVAEILKILDKHSAIELILRQAIECPNYASRLDYSQDFQPFLAMLLNSAQNLRSAVRMLDWKSRVLLVEGNIPEAVETGLLVFQLSQLQEQEPALVNGLVAVALRGMGTQIINRALRAGPLDLDLRKSLDAELATHDQLDWFIRNLKTERAVNLSAAVDLFPSFPMTWQGTMLQGDMIYFYENLLPFVSEPYYVSAKKLSNLQRDSYSTPISNSLIGLLFPALESAQIAANRDLALIRSLRVLNALQAYQAVHSKEATTIPDLDLPESATIDPFDGKPLKLKWTDEGWIVYSVFKNGVDDGGLFDKQQDIGLRPNGLLP